MTVIVHNSPNWSASIRLQAASCESKSLLFCRNMFPCDSSQRIIFGSSWRSIHFISSFDFLSQLVRCSFLGRNAIPTKKWAPTKANICYLPQYVSLWFKQADPLLFIMMIHSLYSVISLLAARCSRAASPFHAAQKGFRQKSRFSRLALQPSITLFWK